ncbi:Uncharacterised protein [uncultured archaeon]|nr:Uncharacterised protein [uncultured archaeon]
MDSTRSGTGARLLAVAIVLLAVLGVSHAAFTRSFMTMQIQVNEDGGADVRNELRFYMTTTDSIDLYKLSIKTTNDLSGWKERLGLNDIRFYTDTSRAPVENIRVDASQPDTCNSDMTACYGTFTYTYHVKPPTNNSGLVNVTKYVRPRVISYVLDPDALAFDVSSLGEQFIPDRTSVEITIPADAVSVSISPRSVEYSDKISKGADKFTWQGRMSLAGAELSFERKESLASEVANFFNDVTKTSMAWLTSTEGMALGGAAALMIIAYFMLQRRKVS